MTILESRRRVWITSATLALLIVTAACGGSAPTQPGMTPTSGTAVIDGRVAVPAGTAMDQPASAATTAATTGLLVKVEGTSLTTSVTAAGTFRLTGVPAGRVRLQFSSTAVNATADLGEVATNDVIQLQVQVNATSAVIVSQTRAATLELCHAEGNGSYHLISVAPDAEPAHRAHGDGAVGEPAPGRPNQFFGERCELLGPAIVIETSTNGEDADTPPGPSVLVGSPVNWSYRVSNTGTVPLTGIVVTDDRGVVVSCGNQTTLAPATSMTCTAAGTATLGQYRNVGGVTASWTMTTPGGTTSGTLADTDASHYLGVTTLPSTTAKVTLCHKTGTTRYIEITVDVDAEPDHRAHGDAKVGEAVPGQAGKVFAAGCVVS